MKVDTPAVQATSQNSGASVATHSATQGVSASQAQSRSTGPRSRPDPKTKQSATDQQGIRNIVEGILESRGVGREDWEQSLRTTTGWNLCHHLRGLSTNLLASTLLQWKVPR